jgi:hypothetical protein
VRAALTSSRRAPALRHSIRSTEREAVGLICDSGVLDMMMLVGPGGQERTEPEYRALLDKAGFQLTRVVPTASAASVVEAVPA